jgi:hypothetical protein
MTKLITTTGQKTNKFGEFDIALAYRAGESVSKDGSVYTANADIPVGTAFIEGTSGTTWTKNIIGLAVDTNGVTQLGDIADVSLSGGAPGQFLQSVDGDGTLQWADVDIPASATEQASNDWSTNVELAVGSPAYPVEGTFAGTVHQVSTQAGLVAAMAAAVAGDIIELTADITLTSTLQVNKEVKITGEYVLQSAGTTTDPVTLITVTAPAYFDETITIKHRKTSNTSVEVAVNVTTTAAGFRSYATVEFMEFGYMLRGQFHIGGKTVYTGPLGNSHRHIAIYRIDAPSVVEDVVFEFPQETTARANIIAVLASAAGDEWNSMLKIKNCSHSLSKYCRQFFFAESMVSTGTRAASLWCEGNSFNSLNGGIGFISSTTSLDFFGTVVLYRNREGFAASSNYKGIFYFDGSGTVRSFGRPTFLAVAENVSPYALRVDYSYALDGSIAYKNTVYSLTSEFTTNIGDRNVYKVAHGSAGSFEIGYRDVPQILLTGSTTITVNDGGKHYYYSGSTNSTLTIPDTTDIKIGTAIAIVNNGTGNILVQRASGVVLKLAGAATDDDRTISPNGQVTILKVSSSTWFISGAGVA